MSQAQKSNQKKPAATKAAEKGASGVRRVAVIGGNRVPFARSNTAYSKISNQELLTSALRGLVDRFGLQGQRLGEVVAGAVIKHSRDFNLTRPLFWWQTRLPLGRLSVALRVAQIPPRMRQLVSAKGCGKFCLI